VPRVRVAVRPAVARGRGAVEEDDHRVASGGDGAHGRAFDFVRREDGRLRPDVRRHGLSDRGLPVAGLAFEENRRERRQFLFRSRRTCAFTRALEDPDAGLAE